jgi:hypothetical protein
MQLVITAPDEVIAPARLVMSLSPDMAMTQDEFFIWEPGF